MEPFWIATCSVLVPGLLYASWIDYSERRVPNWLNATLIAIGFLVQGYYFGAAGMWTGLLGLLVGFGVLIVPWCMHGMGAGDVKMMAAIGVFLGPWMTFVCFAVGAVCGGLIAVIMILAEGKSKYAMANLGIIMTKVSSKDTMFSDFGSAKSFGKSSALLPYGVPLTLGTFIVLCGKFMGWWVI